MASEAAIKVLLADDDSLAAAYVMQLLAPLGSLRVTAVRSLQELRLQLGIEMPDVILTEMRLESIDMAPVIAELCSADGPRVVVLSTDSSEHSVLAAVAAGASGYWLKEHAVPDLGGVILRCSAGEEVLDQRLVGVVMRGYRGLFRHERPSTGQLQSAPLSTRAMQVLELMAAGLRNREIAERLALSEHTVKVYVGQLFAHLNVSDRTAAVMRAIERGLVRVSQ